MSTKSLQEVEKDFEEFVSNTKGIASSNPTKFFQFLIAERIREVSYLLEDIKMELQNRSERP